MSTQTKTPKLVMACRAASISDGGVRCRNTAGENHRCSAHESAELSAPPNVVLFRIRANPRWIERLEEAGVGWHERNDAAIEQRHKTAGEKLRRDAHRYGKGRTDTGTPVFSPGSRENHCLFHGTCEGLLDEMVEAGMVVGSFHLYRRDKDVARGPATLTIKLVDPNVRQLAEGELRGLSVVEELLNVRWRQAYVWVNEPQEDGRVVATVNVKYREPDKQPERRLVWDKGYFNSKEL